MHRYYIKKRSYINGFFLAHVIKFSTRYICTPFDISRNSYLEWRYFDFFFDVYLYSTAVVLNYIYFKFLYKLLKNHHIKLHFCVAAWLHRQTRENITKQRKIKVIRSKRHHGETLWIIHLTMFTPLHVI